MSRACYDTENGEVYCEDHSPGIEPEALPQETDVPENCHTCGKPVDYSLTQTGVQYVIEAALEAMDNFEDIPSEIEGYYRGSPRCSVVGDWARDLLDGYGGLRPAELEVLKQFVAQVDEAEAICSLLTDISAKEIDANDLDELVVSQKGQEAAQLKALGVRNQVRYLVGCLGAPEARKRILGAQHDRIPL